LCVSIGHDGKDRRQALQLLENWFGRAYEIEEFSAFNTLWLSYFIAGGSIGQQNGAYAFKQVLQTVYTSNPDMVGVLFLASKCSNWCSALKARI